MKNKILLVVLLCLVLLAACSPSSKIVGKWANDQGTEMEFFKDGTFTSTEFGLTVSGTYEFIDKDSIKMTMDGLLGIGGPSVMDVKVSGNQVTFTTGGQSFSLEKSK